jgi:hypothetical protein
MKLITDFHIVPRLRTHGTLPPDLEDIWEYVFVEGLNKGSTSYFTKIVVFWVVTPCGDVVEYQRFAGH